MLGAKRGLGFNVAGSPQGNALGLDRPHKVKRPEGLRYHELMAQPRTDIQYVSDEARARREGISPEAVREKLAHVVSDRGERASRLLGAGRKFSPDRDAVTELVEERAAED